MHRIRIKICGITRAEDAVLAARLGADAIGLVFHPPSPRAVSIEQAAAVRRAVPAMVSVFGLFVDPEPERVREVLDGGALDGLQFHGEESPGFCGAFGRPYMKALRVRDSMDVAGRLADYPGAAAILLDSYDPDLAGGTGRRFDWTVARDCVAANPDRIVLAGGLEAGNVAQAVREVGPWALDVSSGVEQAPGIKSRDKMQAFFNEVHRVQFAG